MRNKLAIIVGCVVLLSGAWNAQARPNPFNFGADQLLVNTAGLTSDQSSPAVAKGGGYLHVVWVDMRAGGHLRYIRGHEGGVDNRVDLTSPGYSYFKPEIACSDDGQEIVVTFASDYAATTFLHVYACWSDDGGTTFNGPVRIDDGGDSWDAQNPDVTYVYPSAFVVVWESHQDGGNWEILCDQSLDAGNTWDVDTLVSTGTWSGVYHNQDPAVAADRTNNVFATSTTYNGSQDRVVLHISNDGGQTWDPELSSFTAATPSGRSIGRSDVAAWGVNRVTLAWLEYDSGFYNADVHATFTWDGGVSFIPGWQTIVNQDPGLYEETSVAVTVDGRGGIYFLFESLTPSSHVYMAYSFTRLLTIHGDYKVDGAILTGSAGDPAAVCNTEGTILTVFTRTAGINTHIYADYGSPPLQDSFDDPTFPDWDIRSGVERSAAQSYNTGYSAEFSDDTIKAEGLLQEGWTDQQQGLVSFYFWDGWGSDPAYETTGWTGGVEHDDGSKAGVVRSLGIVNPGSTSNYEATGPDKAVIDTGIPRSQGWHLVQMEVDDSGIRIYLDESDYPSLNPVLNDPSFTYATELVFEGGSDAAPYYLDEVICAVGPETVIPATGAGGLVLLLAGLGILIRRRRR